MRTENKCEHNIVILSTKKKPHIWGCKKCFKYSPKPHPHLTDKEVKAMLGFTEVVNKSKSEAKEDAKLL